MNDALTTKSFSLGVKAFDRGVNCAPVLDKALWDYIHECALTGDALLAAFDGWTSGWAEANLTQEVAGWTAEQNAALFADTDPQGTRRARVEAARAS